MKFMKLGIVLNTNDAETCWNCFRFGNEALKCNHAVKVFLLGKGVEVEDVKDAKFPFLEGTIKKFLSTGGSILACGTCLKSRDKEGSMVCPVSTMEEPLKMVEESEKILTFG